MELSEGSTRQTIEFGPCSFSDPNLEDLPPLLTNRSPSSKDLVKEAEIEFRKLAVNRITLERANEFSVLLHKIRDASHEEGRQSTVDT